MAHLNPAEAEQLFQPHEEPLPVPANSPISKELREALVWLRKNGIAECTLEHIGSFAFRPPESDEPPTIAALDLTPKDDENEDKSELVVGGYQKDILFAHVSGK